MLFIVLIPFSNFVNVFKCTVSSNLNKYLFIQLRSSNEKELEQPFSSNQMSLGVLSSRHKSNSDYCSRSRNRNEDEREPSKVLT